MVIAILITISLVGAGVFGYFYGGTSPISSSSSVNNDYSSLKSRVDALNQQVKSNSNDIQLQQDLGNAYYDSASAAQKNAPNEVHEDYYGVFLSDVRKDYPTAIRMWQTALDKNPNGSNADQLKQLISQTKNMQATQQNTYNPSANTPSNKTP